MTTIEEQLIEDPFSFELIENKTEELALFAVSINSKVLAVIPEAFQTKAVCKLAINDKSLNLEYVKNPTMKLCFYAILKSGFVKKLLNFVPVLDGKFEIIKRIMNNVDSITLHLILKTKFNVEIWTEALILQILAENFLSPSRLKVFITFLQESKIQITKSIKKHLISYCLHDIELPILWTDRDIKKRLESSKAIGWSTQKGQLESLEMSLHEFYKCTPDSQLNVLRHTKNIKEGMILYCGVKSPLTVITICLQRDILTADLLVKIVRSMHHKKNYQDLSVTSLAFLENCGEALKKLELTDEQIGIIKGRNPALAKRFEKNSISDLEKLEADKVKSRTIINNNANAVISNYLKNVNGDSNGWIVTVKQLNDELDKFKALDKLKSPTGVSQNNDPIPVEPIQNIPISDHNDIFRMEYPGEKEYKSAVEYNGNYLKYIPGDFKTLSICVIACQQNKESIQYVPTSLVDEVTKIVGKPVEIKERFRVVVIDKLALMNYREEMWNPEEELLKLQQLHANSPITMNLKVGKDSCNRFKFVKDNVVIKSVLILN